MKALEFKNVSLNYYGKDYETTALENLSFTIEEGQFTSIVGPSGCGKTTILSLISGLIKPTAGEVLIYNKSCNEIQQNNKSYIGYMFQKDQLFEWRKVIDNIMLGLEVTHTKTKDNIEYVKSLLKKYGIWEFKDKYPHELSGGMRQRVALIRTLALHPKIMLLDEAFSALDFQTRITVCDDIYKILKEEKITSILVTHDITEAITMSDKIIVLTSRPAKLKSIYNLSYDRNLTPLKRRDNSKVSEIFDNIWGDLTNEKKC